jgi:hypothetical protein
MADERPTSLAPHGLTRLSKATLADMAWGLAAAVNASIRGDTEAQYTARAVLQTLIDTAKTVGASGAELGRLKSLLEEYKGSTPAKEGA